MDNNYRNPRTNVRGAGTIGTALTGKRKALATASALAVTVSVDWQYGKCVDWRTLDPHGPINGKSGRNIVRRRWDTTYRAHCDYYGIPHGRVYLPCYICGHLFDAWTMDVEHVGGREDAGTAPGLIMLACSGCNTVKSDSRRLPWQVIDMLTDSPAARVGYARTTSEVHANWSARARRIDGSTQSSSPYMP